MTNIIAWMFRCVMKFARSLICLLGLALLGIAGRVVAQSDDPGLPVPPRIGMVSGQASFWRPGAPDWTTAQVNMPLAAGDAIYTSNGAAMEVQVGSRAYVRLAQNAMLTLLDDEPRMQQYKVSSGIVSFDLRSLGGREIEIDTPSGAYRIDSAGYYRVEIDDDTTHFTVRRGGQAIVTLADGNTRLIAPSQEAVVDAGDGVRDVDTYVAPDMDSWDEWNLTRTDDLMDAISNRYVPADVYGTDDLDHYGDWRNTPDYGAVWVPRDVGPDWVPYSTGAWIWDPAYTWTWVDAAPWGWAPYHYGRWVNVGGYWAWAPGPRHVHAIYAPALVAFFHSGNTSISITSGPAVSWVALGWGEPCVPWWGRSRFAGRPWWGGWGGPRVVNNVVVNRTAINNIAINQIRYQNAQKHNALVAVPQRDFGHGRLNVQHMGNGRQRGFVPTGAQLPMKPAPASLVPTVARSAVPNANVLNRSAVVTRDPPHREMPWRSRADAPRGKQPVHADAPQNRIIKARPAPAQQQIPNARFGRAVGEERQPRQLPAPPSFSPPNAPERRAREMPRGDAQPASPARNEGRRDINRTPDFRGNANRVEAPVMPQREREMPRAPAIAAPPPAPVVPRAQAPMRIDAIPGRVPQREMQTPAPIPRRLPQSETPMPAPVPPRVQEQRQLRETPRPMPQAAPQRQQPQMRFERRQELPGQPANQMYRGHEPRNDPNH